MSHIAAYLGIVSAFSFMVFIANQQLKEIRSLKAQLAIERDYSKDLEVDTSVCKADVDYLKSGLEQVIDASKKM